jgi:hypothetical protein
MKKIDLSLNIKYTRSAKIKAKEVEKYLSPIDGDRYCIEEMCEIKLPIFLSVFNLDFIDVVLSEKRFFISDLFSTIYYGSKIYDLKDFSLRLPAGFAGKKIKLCKLYYSKEDLNNSNYEVVIEYKGDFYKIIITKTIGCQDIMLGFRRSIGLQG